LSSKTLKRLFHPGEAPIAEELRAICTKYSARFYGKTQLLEVFEVNQATDSRDYSFCWSAHFDFLLTDHSNLPLLAVEFDGRHHQDPKQVRADRTKNRICREVALPIIRIGPTQLRKTYRGFNILAYLIEYWFIEQQIESAYQSGIDRSELFDPTDMLFEAGNSAEFPFQLDFGVDRQIAKLFREKKILDHEFSMWIGINRQNGSWTALTVVRIPGGLRWVRTNLGAQDFPIDYIEVLPAISRLDLLAEIERANIQKYRPQAREPLKQLMQALNLSHEEVFANSSPRKPKHPPR
jgi:hypothetical protein